MSRERKEILIFSIVAALLLAAFLTVLCLALPIGHKLLPMRVLLWTGIPIASVFFLSAVSLFVLLRKGS